MPRIEFDKPGEHFYETGVSKGVLYPKSSDTEGYAKGVAWNGLSSISESPEGAEESAIYADNIKYLSLRSIEEFKGTIEAYTFPEEFEACDGSKSLGLPGVKATQQARIPFCFSYQTKKGSDENPELGYIIHLVYAATASPSEKAYETVNDSPEAITFSWEFTTVPVALEGFKNISHIEIDSTKFNTEELKAKLKEIEDALYGTDSETIPAVPCVAALTTDTEIVPTKVYYTRQSSAKDPGHLVDADRYEYTPVEAPVVEDISTYYEVSVEGSDERTTEGTEPKILMPNEIVEILKR